MTRQAFIDAANFFIQVVEQIPGDRWSAPGLGVWTVQDLVGHTCRALTTIKAYTAQPAQRVELADPVDYLITALKTLGQPDLVAERGRQGECLP